MKNDVSVYNERGIIEKVFTKLYRQIIYHFHQSNIIMYLPIHTLNQIPLVYTVMYTLTQIKRFIHTHT